MLRPGRSGDAAVGAGPVLGAEFAFEDLAGTGYRESVGDLEAPGCLVAGDQRLDVIAQVLGGQGRAGAQHDDGVHALAPLGVGDADDGALGHGRVAGHGVLHLGRVDVLAAADDHVLDPVDDEQVAAGVQVAAVAGVHPAAPEGVRRLLRLVPVALHDVPAAADDLADDSGRDLGVVRV